MNSNNNATCWTQQLLRLEVQSGKTGEAVHLHVSPKPLGQEEDLARQPENEYRMLPRHAGQRPRKPAGTNCETQMLSDPEHHQNYDPTVELVRVTPVPAIIVEMEKLSIVVVNEATIKLLGYSENELLGHSITEFVPTEDVLAVERAAEEPPPEGETQWRCIKKGGTLLYLKLKYRDTIFENKAARFVVTLASSSKPFK